MLYVGRLRSVKGVEFGIRSFALVKDKRPNSYMALAGEGEQLPYLQALVDDLGISNHVNFLGVRNDLPDLLSAADSVLMPSLNEGFPRTAIEAMAAGKPVVASDIEGFKGLITDGDQGLLVPKKNSAALANALGKLAMNPELRSKLGTRGNKTAMNFRWEVVASQVENYYETCLKAAKDSTNESTRTRTD